MHRTLNRLAALLFQHDLFDEEGTWQLISHYLSQNPALKLALKQAFNHSLAFALQKSSQHLADPG